MSFRTTADHIPLEPATQRLLEGELKPGETVLWQSAPIARRHRMMALPIFLFAIPWTAFSVFWMAMAASGSGFFALFGLPFLLIGVGMLCSPWWAARLARRTAYALTTDRAIILTPAPFGSGISVRSFAPADLAGVERVQRGDGSGDLILARELVRGSKGHMHEKKTGFMGVPAVQTVQLRIDEMVRAHQAATARLRAESAGS
jgi:hypothetical protein